MSQSRVAQQGSGRKGFCSGSAFVPAKSGRDLFLEGAPLSACLTNAQASEWKAAEAAEIEAYLAEEAKKTAKREAFVAQVREGNRALQVAESNAKRDLDLARSLAYLDGCRLEGMPAAKACAVLC